MHQKKNDRQLLIVASLMLLFVALSTQAFGQGGTNASLSGTIQDASQAVLPGATVTATNTATGVQVKATTNNAGVYNIGGLQSGTYKVTAEMTGFQTNTKTEVRLDVGAQVRLNFEMKVAGVATQIEISSSVQDMILESSSSTGTVLQEKTITALPNLNNDMMDLINVMGGVVRNDADSVFGNSTQTFGGVSSTNVNVQRDGITVSDVRFTTSGIVSPGRLNPDMVSEFKMVLTPVDAEMGRGAGQVQVLTKSGTNAFHGSGLWSIMNTSLDANEWSSNKTHTIPNYRNLNEYTISASGPIIKNKTFFFVTWDQAIVRQRQTVLTPVLTNCARKGIYRYFNGWIPGNTQSTVSTTLNANTRSSVDVNGNPLVPAGDRLTPNGPYTAPQGLTTYQGLQFQSVLGQLTAASIAQIAADPVNCSQYASPTVGGANGLAANSNWDPFRKAYDPSGFTANFSSLMPKANDFYSGGQGGWGDGLNVADLKWTRTTPGQDTVYGTGEDNGRRSITAKLDHNLNSKNRLSGTISYEYDLSADAIQTWPSPIGFSGSNERKPITFTVSFTSTLRPTLLNEFRGGLAYNAVHTEEPTTGVNGPQMKDLLQKLLPTSNWPNWKGLPVVIGPGSGSTSFVPDFWSIGLATAASNPYGANGNLPATWGDHDYRWTIADTVTWTKGAHSFRGGAEVRITNSNQDWNGWGQFSYSSNTFPYVQGGNTGVGTSYARGIGTNWVGMTGTDNGAGAYSGTWSSAYNLMDYMAGSVSAIRQYYFVNSAQSLSWDDPTTTPERLMSLNQRELSFFFKDDWKVNSSLILNLGLRWDYFGIPWVDNGMTAGLKGGALSLFGGSAGGFGSWLQSPSFNTANLTVQQFIGPGSPNPNQQPYNKDLNSFGPAIGFAWQLPWFGKGKTTLRGGYQVSYTPIASSDPNGGYGAVIGNVANTINPVSYSGDPAINSGYLDLSNLQNLIPIGSIPTQGTTLANLVPPFRVYPTTYRGGTSSLGLIQYDPNIRNPYIESLTMALTRNVGSNVTVDVRYIGTMSRKQLGTLALNSTNWISNGLLQALTTVRAGGQSDLLNRIIPANSLAFGAATGSDQVRTSFYTYTALAQGNFASVASTLGSTNGFLTVPVGTVGGVLRAGGAPENFVVENPQYSSVNWQGNLDNANYHSLQAQVTLRPTHNLNLQGTYTFSRNLGYMGTGTSPLNRGLDYGLLSSSRKHNLSTYGTYTLPLGTNGYLFRDSSKAVKRAVEGWQLSWISYNYSGIPGSIAGVASMWGGSQPDLVRPDLWNPNGHVSWADGDVAGYFYGKNKYMYVTDPQCANVQGAATNNGLYTYCALNLHALAVVDHLDSNGNPVAGPIVFQHAAPGTKGNYNPDTVIGQGRWGLDMTASKNIEIVEGKSLNIRIDAMDVLNHASPSGAAPTSYNSRNYSISDPNFGINTTTTPFGYIPYKAGHRVFSAKLRFTF